jgi:hypothetical protein
MDDDGRGQAVARVQSSYSGSLIRLAGLLVRDEPTVHQVVHECFTTLYDGWYDLPTDHRSLSYLKQAISSAQRSLLEVHRHQLASDTRWSSSLCEPVEGGRRIATSRVARCAGAQIANRVL